MQATLAPLTLRPQSSEPDFQLTGFRQRFRVQFPDPGPAVRAHGPQHLLLGLERLLAAHARRRFLREFHEPADCRGGHIDGTGMLAREQLTGFLRAEDGLKNALEWARKLIVEVVLCVNRDIVFQYVEWVFGLFVVLRIASSFDDDIADAITDGGCGTKVALSHTFHELHMGLLVVVFLFRKSFGDDKIGHVDFVLEQRRYHILDVANQILSADVMQQLWLEA